MKNETINQVADETTKVKAEPVTYYKVVKLDSSVTYRIVNLLNEQLKNAIGSLVNTTPESAWFTSDLSRVKMFYQAIETIEAAHLYSQADIDRATKGDFEL